MSRIEIPCDHTLYQINTDMGVFFTACTSEDALHDSVIDKINRNAVILSVNRLCPDGSRPRVRVLTDKRFKKRLKANKDKFAIAKELIKNGF